MTNKEIHNLINDEWDRFCENFDCTKDIYIDIDCCTCPAREFQIKLKGALNNILAPIEFIEGNDWGISNASQ